MNFSKICKIIAVIVAIAGLAAAAYVAIKKLTEKEKPEYYDDNDFFECDNDLEIIEVNEDEAEVEEKAEEPKAAPKKKTAKKKAE